MTNKKISRGSSSSYTIKFTKPDKTPKDITGYEVYVTIRDRNTMSDADDTTTILDKQASITDAPGGLASLTISQSESSSFPVGLYVGSVSIKDLTKPVGEQFSESVDRFSFEVLSAVNKVS